MPGWRRLIATQLITYEMTAACLWRVIHQQRHPSQAWREHLLMAEARVVGIRLSTSSGSWLAGLTGPCDWKEVTTRVVPGSSHQGEPRCTLPFIKKIFVCLFV